MLDLIDKLHLVVPALLALNILLSAAGQVLAVLGRKEIPVLSQISIVLKKILDFISANSAH